MEVFMARHWRKCSRERQENFIFSVLCEVQALEYMCSLDGGCKKFQALECVVASRVVICCVFFKFLVLSALNSCLLF